MSKGKIVGLILSGVIVLLLFFVMFQDSSTTPAPIAKEKVEQKRAEVVVKTEEERKLEELQKEAQKNVTINKMSKLYTLKCRPCHGNDGQGIVFAPSIRGKSVNEILVKLEDYKQDKVHNTLMKGLLTNVSNEEMKVLAEEISNFK